MPRLLTKTVVALNLLLLSAAFASADDSDKGFTSIFNGKDLTGWSGRPEFWSVQDGAITGQTTKEKPTNGNTFIIWKDGKLGDFELRLKFRIVGGNSGIQYRSREVGDGTWVISGYQADFDSNGRVDEMDLFQFAEEWYRGKSTETDRNH